MEHRWRLERDAEHRTGLANGGPGSRVFEWCADDGNGDDGRVTGSFSRRSSCSGGDRGRDREANDAQRDQSLLRTAEFGDQLGAPPPAGNRDGDGDLPSARRLIENLNTAIIVLDDSFLIHELNPAAENLLGISQQRAIQKPLLPLLGDHKDFETVLSRVLESAITYANEIQLGPTEVHSESRVVDCRVSSLRGRGAGTILLVEMTDVTRRLKINRENALLIQHGAGRQMIRQLAHEIKNPLGGLRGAAQLLGKQLDREELQEYTDVIISEADRLADLVDTLLGPGGPPNKQPTNIHEVLEYVMRVLSTEVGDKLTIRRDYDPGLPLIPLDRDQIVQALLNVVRNAAAALDGHGTITLRSRAMMNFTIGDTRHRNIVSIEIEDDGPGIPADLQGSIFYPLVTSRPDGTGLGLPAAQELLSRHSGLIEFESRPGKTTFFLRIPLAAKKAIPRG